MALLPTYKEKYPGYNIDEDYFIGKQKEVVNKLIKYFKINVRKKNNPNVYAIGCNVELVLLDSDGFTTEEHYTGIVNKDGNVVDLNGDLGIAVNTIGVYKVFFYGSGMDIEIPGTGNTIPYTEIWKVESTDVASDTSGVVIIDVLAISVITAFNLITKNGNVADSNDPHSLTGIIGIATQDTLPGFMCPTQIFGLMTNNSWSWVGYELFLNGTDISEIAPETGFVKNIGIIKNSTTILVNLENSILL